MSDLISRSQLLKEIETWGGCVDALHDYIQNMPTAYDIDKVVEELEKATQCIKINEKPTSVKAIHPTQAIEIVKQGGVADDVCEYENTDDEYCKWKINSVFLETINNPHVAERENIETAKYCPCCGKKIKVVE